MTRPKSVRLAEKRARAAAIQEQAVAQAARLAATQTCEVFHVGDRRHGIKPGRCGKKPIVARGQVDTTGEFVFPLCVDHVDRWPRDTRPENVLDTTPP